MWRLFKNANFITNNMLRKLRFIVMNIVFFHILQCCLVLPSLFPHIL